MKKCWKILLAALVFALLASNIFFIVHDGYLDKFLFRYAGKERSNVPPNDEATTGWRESLEQLNYDADIAFFGDSITSMGHWQEWFPEKKIINLGISANSLQDMEERIGMVYSVKPEKVFIMGGVNGVTKGNIDPYVRRYASIVSKLQENLPGVKIYVQSVLPVSPGMEKHYNMSNDAMRQFNEALRKICEEKGCVFVDLFPLYEKDGVMNRDLTSDGVHLVEGAYEPWIEAIRPYVEE